MQTLFKKRQLSLNETKTVFEAFDPQIKVTNLKELQGARSNSVYRIDTKSESFVIKIYTRSQNARSVFNSHIKLFRDVPHPEILHLDDSLSILEYPYLIMEYVPSQSLEQLLLRNAHLTHIYHELGTILVKIHSHQQPQSGWFDSSATVIPQSPYDMLSSYIQKTIPSEVLHTYFNGGFESVIKILKKIPSQKKYHLIHGDFSPKNIGVQLTSKDQKITIYDFELFSLFSPWVDIGILARDTYSNQNNLEPFCESYGCHPKDIDTLEVQAWNLGAILTRLSLKGLQQRHYTGTIKSLHIIHKAMPETRPKKSSL